MGKSFGLLSNHRLWFGEKIVLMYNQLERCVGAGFFLFFKMPISAMFAELNMRDMVPTCYGTGVWRVRARHEHPQAPRLDPRMEGDCGTRAALTVISGGIFFDFWRGSG